MKNIKGFTLIEVIVTITLLAVLMAIVVPISLSYMDNIQEKKILNEAEAVLSQGVVHILIVCHWRVNIYLILEHIQKQTAHYCRYMFQRQMELELFKVYAMKMEMSLI